MKIYTLGTSHGDSTFNRFNSSTAYETSDGHLYLVDAGAPVEALIRRKGLSVKDLRAVFVTHLHDDHAGGLPGLIKQVTKYRALRADEPLPIFLPEEKAIEPLKAWVRALHENADDVLLFYQTVTDGEIFRDENLVVSAVRTRHLRTISRVEGDPCSFAFILHFLKENVRVLHTGDLWSDFSDFPSVAFTENFDVCLCEATHCRNASLVHPIYEKCRFGRMIFIHVFDDYHTRIYPGWVAENGEKMLEKLYGDLAFPVSVAHDGDEYLLVKGKTI